MNTVISAKWGYISYKHQYEAYMVFSDRPNTIYTSRACSWHGDMNNIARRFAETYVNMSHEERVEQVDRFVDVNR
jgi:hypothetical protein